MFKNLCVAACAAMVTVALAAPADACEPVHTLKKKQAPISCPAGEIAVCDQDANGNFINCICVAGDMPQLCWTGPCKKLFNDGFDTLGRFMVDRKGDYTWLIDKVFMKITNETTGTEYWVIDERTAATCDISSTGFNPAAAIPLSSVVYAVKNFKACPSNSAPCANSQRVTIRMPSLDIVNNLTTDGANYVLSDGQVVESQRRNRFWLYYEQCAPDAFGDPGDQLRSKGYYATVNPITGVCVIDETRPVLGGVEPIPAASPQCP